ncbi:MAG: HalOD1 output domain-containing protein, partial [Salinigranum sp.]
IANLEGIEACDLEFTLSEYVDPDALDRLFADRNETSVHFLIEEYDIYVLSPQEIRIRTS